MNLVHIFDCLKDFDPSQLVGLIGNRSNALCSSSASDILFPSPNKWFPPSKIISQESRINERICIKTMLDEKKFKYDTYSETNEEIVNCDQNFQLISSI